MLLDDCGEQVGFGQVICVKCTAYNECVMCKRSLRKARFTLHDDICESCFKKRNQSQSGAGVGISQSVEGVF